MSDLIVKTLADVARACDTHPNTVRQWISKGMPREQIAPDGLRNKYRYDLKKIEEWRAVRLTGNQGGNQYPAISNDELKDMKKNLERFKGAIDFYKINRADIFANKQMGYQKLADWILSTLTAEEFKDATLGGKLAALKVLDTGAAIYYDKERLERGESTQNVGILVGAIKELKRKREPKPIGETSRTATG